MSEKSKPPKEVTTSFTIDNDESLVNEMPGVTKLLNRKSFKKPMPSALPVVAPPSAPPGPPPVGMKPPTPPPMKAPPAPPVAPPSMPPASQAVTSIKLEMPEASSTPSEPALEPAPASAAPAKGTLSIQRVTRRRTTGTPLLAWTANELKAGSDPLGKAILSLAESNASQFLFLSVETVPGKALPIFKAHASLNAGPQAAIWAGLHWDPQLLPQVWSSLLSTGSVEFSPPGTKTNIESARNLSRSAFDTSPELWLTLVRVGLPKECRGLLAVVSKVSIAAAVKKAMPLLNQAPQAPAKKSA